MPPESKTRNTRFDNISYALGAILYALLTGRPPFQTDSDFDTLVQVLEQEPVPPRLLNHHVPRDLETICLKCLSKDPRQRYESVQALTQDVDRYLQEEPILARPLGPIGRAARWARSQPTLAVTLVSLALFYANHLVCLYILKHPDEGGAFHSFFTRFVLVWALGAWTFQRLSLRPRSGAPVVYGWATMNVLMCTIFLLAADGPKSPVTVAYLLLAAGSGLRFRTRLVSFVTGLCMCGYLLLIFDARWHRPEYVIPFRANAYFLVTLAVTGLIMYLVLRRLRLVSLTDSSSVSSLSPANKANGHR